MRICLKLKEMVISGGESISDLFHLAEELAGLAHGGFGLDDAVEGGEGLKLVEVMGELVEAGLSDRGEDWVWKGRIAHLFLLYWAKPYLFF